MAVCKIDLRTKYSLSHVRIKDLAITFVVAWLIASIHQWLSYGKFALQILELLCHVHQRIGVTLRLMWV